MPRPGQRVLLLGGDTDFNVGDRAILTALVRCFTAHDPNTEISTVGRVASGPAVPGVSKVIPRGPRGLRALMSAAAAADRVLLAGGGLFQDDDSRAKVPYWAARIALLRTCNAHIAGFAVGAGPLDHAECRAAVRFACAALSRISVRDRFARDALAACTSRPLDIVPDPAFMLEPASREEAGEYLRRLGFQEGKPLIVAAVRRWYHERGGFVPNAIKIGLGIEPKRDLARFEGMLGVLSKALETLRHRLEADILLLPSYNVGHEADDAACEALQWRLPGGQVRLARVTDPRLYKALLGHAALVVSARMHPLILAAGMGVPFVGLSYNGKFDGLYELLGLSTRSLPLDQCSDSWGSTTLVAAAETALESRVDLRPRADGLSAAVRREALAAAFGPSEAPAFRGPLDA